MASSSTTADNVELCILAQHANSQSLWDVNGNQIVSLSVLCCDSYMEFPCHMLFIGAPALTEGKWLMTTVGIPSVFPAPMPLGGCSSASGMSSDLSVVGWSRVVIAKKWPCGASLLRSKTLMVRRALIGTGASSVCTRGCPFWKDLVWDRGAHWWYCLWGIMSRVS